MKGRLRTPFIVVLLFVVIVIFYWRFTLSGQYELMWSPDQAQQVLPWIHVAARQWRAGTAPLWDPHMWGGQPLLGQAQPGVAYFLNWILYSLPAKNGYFSSDLLHWYYAVIHTMAAAFCFALCRDLRRSVPASFIAGLIYSLTGYLAVTDWPQMMNGAVWAPLVLMFLLRSVEGRGHPIGSAALSGLFLGLAWLSGHHQVPLFLSLASGAIWAFHSIHRRRLNWTVLRAACVAFVICGLVGALQILPAREYGVNSVRWVGAPNPVGWDEKVPYSSHEPGGMTPSSIIGIVVPGMATISEPFVGFTAFTLAMLALRVRAVRTERRDRRVLLFACIGAGAFVYALGSHTPLEGILYALAPLVEKARTPGAAIFLFTLSVAVLAAHGLDTVGRRAAKPTVGTAVKVLCCVAVFLVLTVLALTVSRIGADQRLARAALYTFLSSGLLVALRSRLLGFRTLVMLFGALVLLEAGGVMHTPADKKGDLMKYLNSKRLNRDIAYYLKQQPPPFRLIIGGDEFPGNWAAYHNLDAMTGYLASLSVNVTSVAAHNRNVQMLWGTRYMIGNQAETPEDVEVFTGRSGRKLFERRSAFERAWIVHRVEKSDSRQHINASVEADLPSFASRALMTETPPAVDSCNGGDSARYERPRGDTVVVQAQLACKGLLVISDTYFPGWKAEVDGAPVGIHEVNGAMRGVVLPAGKHRVTMVYRPTAVWFGAFLTAIGVIGAIVLARWTRTRRPPPTRLAAGIP